MKATEDEYTPQRASSIFPNVCIKWQELIINHLKTQKMKRLQFLPTLTKLKEKIKEILHETR